MMLNYFESDCILIPFKHVSHISKTSYGAMTIYLSSYNGGDKNSHVSIYDNEEQKRFLELYKEYVKDCY